MSAIDLLMHFADASLGVGILIALVFVVRKPVARYFGPQAAYLLWLAPAMRLFLPELYILPAPEFAQPTFFFADAASSPIVTAARQPPSFSAALLLTSALYIWIAGALGWLNITIAAHRKFMRRMIASSEPANAGLQNKSRSVMTEIGYSGPLSLRVFKTEDGPMTAGLFRPVIFLPAGFETHYTVQEQRLALIHEIAHIARGDLFAGFAAMIFRTLQWPNPLVHFGYRLFRIDQEAACDAFVVKRHAHSAGAGHAYAAAIVKSARTNAVRSSYGLSLAHPIKERLMLLKNPILSPLRRLAGNTLAIAMIGAGLAATASYSYAAPQPPAAPEAPGSETVNKETTKMKSVITVDKGEEMQIDGIKRGKARKVVFTNENGDKEIKVFDKRGKVILHEKRGPGEALSIKNVTTITRDGEEHIIMLNEAPRAHEAVRVIMPHDDPTVSVTECTSGGDNDDVQVFSWTHEDGGDKNTFVTRQVICLKSTDGSADPEARAKALRKAIAHLENEGKRAERRRMEAIVHLNAELAKIEGQ